MISIIRLQIYSGPPIKLIHLRYLRLKTNGDDQNSKQQKIYGTKLRHFIVRIENQK